MLIEIALGTALFKVIEKMADVAVIKPLLDKGLEPLTKWITSDYDAKKADEEVRVAFQKTILNMGAPENDDDLQEWLKKRGLNLLLSNKNEPLRAQMVIELIGFTEKSAKPPESLMRALGWPISQADELSFLLADLRTGLAQTSWRPLLSFANEEHANNRLDSILEILNKLNNLIIFSDNGQSLRVMVEKAGLSYEQAAQIEDEYRNEIISELYWHKFSGIAQVKKDTRLPLEKIYLELGFLSLKDEDEHHAIRQKMLTLDLEARMELEEDRLSDRVTDVLEKSQRLVILGDPGSGKTFSLRYIALMLAYGNGISRIGIDSEYLPLFIRLADYATALIKKPAISFDNFLFKYIQESHSTSDQLGEFLRYVMEQGKCIFLADGLDELSSDMNLGNSSHANIVKAIDKFSDFWCDQKGNRIIVSSRIDGYWNDPLCGFSHVQLSPLRPPEEIEIFLNRWFTAHEIAHDGKLEWNKANESANKKVEELLPQILSIPSIRRMAVNPLLLTILALIDDNHGRLPNRRISLYKISTQTLIESWREAQSDMPDELKSELGDEKIIRIMATLAYWLHENHPGGTASIAEWQSKLIEILIAEGFEATASSLTRRFLHHARFQTGILAERSFEQFGFFHLTFEEYLAARQIARQKEENRKMMLAEHWNDPRWQEVIILSVGQLGIEDARTDDASDFLLDLLQMEPSSHLEMGRPAYLAGLAMADIGKSNVNKKVREWVMRDLKFSAQDVNPETEMQYMKVHVSPLVRFNCANLVDDLGFEPQDLYSFVFIPNEQEPEFMIARYPVTNVQYASFLNEKNFNDSQLWCNIRFFLDPNNIRSKSNDIYSGNEGWLRLVRNGFERKIENNSGIVYPGYWNSPDFGFHRRNVPVVGVTWWEANAYCRWLHQNWDQLVAAKYNYPKPIEIRLPNEIEWDMALKSQNQIINYSSNDEIEKSMINNANTRENDIRQTSPVWMYKYVGNYENLISDLIGNVWEWQSNYYDSSNEYISLKGGSWATRYVDINDTFRYSYRPHYWFNDVGFRVLCKLSSV